MHPFRMAAVAGSLLLLFLLALAAGQQQQMMPSFSAADEPWRPTQADRTLVSPNRDIAAGFVPSRSRPGKFRFAVWVANVSSSGGGGSGRTILWHAHHAANALEADGATSTLLVDATGVLSWTDPSAAANTTIWTWSLDATTTTAPVLKLTDTGNLLYGGENIAEPTHTLVPDQPVPKPGNGGGGGTTTLLSGNGRYRLVDSVDVQHCGPDSDSDTCWTTYANMTDNSGLLGITANGTLRLRVLTFWNPWQLVAIDHGPTKRLRRLTLDDDGNLRLYSLQPRTRLWRIVWKLVQEPCTIGGVCRGDNTICVPVGADGVNCTCPPGFRNKTSDGGGCEPRKRYSGRGGDDKFVPMDFVSFSGGAHHNPSYPGAFMTDQSPKNLADCESSCRRNASCLAFGYKLGGHRTCLLYTRLVDGYWSPATEMCTHLRVASDDKDTNPYTGMTSMTATVCPMQLALPEPPKEAWLTTAHHLAIIATLFVAELLAGILVFWTFLHKYSRYREMARTVGLEHLPAGTGGARRFSYAELKAATNGFTHVVGRGAYGTVYRGELPDRRAVAVKELHGAGGGPELWAEATVIARMHHLNLVSLWGFCADKDQPRMLVYEYVPNGSLDKYLFTSSSTQSHGGDENENKMEIRKDKPVQMLDLHTRYRIVLGVARAIAYLHEECLEWVLHCDIKPENILLGEDLCPKVSDFGLSKLTSNKEKVTMSRIRGTRGYMAPEWVIHREPITAKADVYSFGMVLLEMVSGRRSSGFWHESMDSEDWYFPKWAYKKVYVERRIEDVMDPRITADDDMEGLATVERMVKTAMWCLQDRAEIRPSMGKVTKMLEGTVEMTDPVKPTIFCVQEEPSISSRSRFSGRESSASITTTY